jgi:predicted permease
MLAEGLLLGVTGAVVAVVLAWALIRVLVSVDLPIPGHLLLDLRLDVRVLAFALIVALGAGVLASLVPALKASSPRLAGELRGETPAGRVAGRRLSLRDLLVVGQLALTSVLLVVAGLLLRSLAASYAADVGFPTTGLAMIAADTDMVRYTPERGRQFWEDALARVKSIPGVRAAALVSPRLPFDVNYNQTTIKIDGKAYGPDERGEVVANVAVSPEYFDTMGIAVLEGRVFDDRDREGAPLVAVINEAMARRYWPDGSAVGRTFTLVFGTSPYQVIGVVRNHRVSAVNEAPTPYLHFAERQRPFRYNYLVARAAANPGAVLAAMRRELLAMEPGLVFINSTTMDQSIEGALLPSRAAAALASGFGGLGTLLAAVGLYGVIAFSVARRSREIGVRMAVGADARRVLGLVLRQGLGLAAVGAAVGALLAAAAAQLLGGLLYGVSPFDPVAWTAALAVLLIAALLANLLPARRAMRVNPVAALRAD